MIKILGIKSRSRKLLSGLMVTLFFVSFSAFAQSDWKVSDAKSSVNNPVQSDDASVKEGKALFYINCKSCHGEPGENNALALVPKPTDMANVAFLRANSDGSLFAKMTEGKVTMPSFQAVLSETQRWQIVNFIRSFDTNKKVTTLTVIKNEGQLVSAPYQVSLEYLTTENMLIATVLGTTGDGGMAAASDVEVGFFVKRKFGNLPIGERGGVTDANGAIQALVPIDLPGGEEGKALAFVRLAENNEVKAEAEVNVKPIHFVNLLDERSLWTVRVMAPWWLIFTYFGILIGVWGTLGYVVLQLFKIKKEGV